MKRTIGVVAEGPRDFDVIAAVIDSITGEENDYQHLQPEPNANGEFGNGWKGVWKWCESHRDYLSDYFYSVTPHLDLLVIHMDADVARREQEVHCWCNDSLCADSKDIHPLACSRVKKDCPIKLPCDKHEETQIAQTAFLKTFLGKVVGHADTLPICFMTPCDSTDAWIVAAYEEGNEIEKIYEPWETVICHAPMYHGVRIRNRPSKSKIVYQMLVNNVVTKWSAVCAKCTQAKAFDNDIRYLLMRTPSGDEVHTAISASE